MSTSKLDSSGVFSPVTVQSNGTELSVPANAMRIRTNGIEFRSTAPIPVWTEMTVTLTSPQDGRKVRATGVVVDCQGSRHTDYSVSLVFTEVSRQAQARLSEMAYSTLA